MNKLGLPQLLCISSADLSPNTLFGALFVPESARCVVYGCRPDAKAFIQILRFSNGKLETERSQANLSVPNLKDSSQLFSLKCATFDASALSSRHLVAADLNGGLHVFDLNENEAKPLESLNNAHQMAINAVDGAGGLNCHGIPQLATASRDGSVKLWDARLLSSSASLKCVANLCPEQDEPRHDCWTVAFGNNINENDNDFRKCNGDADNVGRLLAAGYSNGDVKIFDLRMNGVYAETNLTSNPKSSEGVCSLSFDRKNGRRHCLVAAGLKGHMCLVDVTKNTSDTFETKLKSSGTLWCVRHLPQNRDICMSSSGSGGLQLWRSSREEIKDNKETYKVKLSMEMVQECDLSDQPLAHFDWCRDKLGLGLTVGFDQQVRAVICTRLNVM